MNFFDDNSDVEHDQFDGIVAHPTIMQARDTETDFGGLLAAPIKLHEDLAKGCGGQIWPAGELLTKYVLKMYMGTHGLRNKRILELGAGGGLTSWVFLLRHGRHGAGVDCLFVVFADWR